MNSVIFLDGHGQPRYREIMPAPTHKANHDQNRQIMYPPGDDSTALSQAQTAYASNQPHHWHTEVPLADGNNENNAPVANMYGVQPVIVPSMTGSFTSMSTGAHPFYNPHSYAVQPSGFARQTWQDGGDFGRHVEYTGTTDMHVSNHFAEAGAANTSYNDFPSFANSLHLHHRTGTPEHHHDQRPNWEKLHGINAAHQRLNAVIDYNDVHCQGRESSAVSVSTIAANEDNDKQSHPSVAVNESTIANIADDTSDSLHLKVQNIHKRPTQNAQSKSLPFARRSCKPTSLSIEKSQMAMSNVLGNQSIADNDGLDMDIVSNSGAETELEADTEDHFSASAFNAANSIARKAPRLLSVNSHMLEAPQEPPQSSASSIGNSGRSASQRNPVKKQQSRGRPKKRGRTTQQVEHEEQIVTLPEDLRQKAYPESLADIYNLITFETDSYNNNPRRQEEVAARNLEIGRENISRGVRNSNLQRRLARQAEELAGKSSPASTPTRSKLKRKAAVAPHSLNSAPRPKSTKLTITYAKAPSTSRRRQGGPVGGLTIGTNHHQSSGRAISDVAVDEETEDELHSSRFSSIGVDTTNVHMGHQHSAVASSSATVESGQTTMLPLLEKVEYVPIQLPHLTKCVEKAWISDLARTVKAFDERGLRACDEHERDGIGEEAEIDSSLDAEGETD